MLSEGCVDPDDVMRFKSSFSSATGFICTSMLKRSSTTRSQVLILRGDGGFVIRLIVICLLRYTFVYIAVFGRNMAFFVLFALLVVGIRDEDAVGLLTGSL